MLRLISGGGHCISLRYIALAIENGRGMPQILLLKANGPSLCCKYAGSDGALVIVTADTCLVLAMVLATKVPKASSPGRLFGVLKKDHLHRIPVSPSSAHVHCANAPPKPLKW